MTDAELDAHISGRAEPLSKDELIDAVEKLVTDNRKNILEWQIAIRHITTLVKRYREQEASDE